MTFLGGAQEVGKSSVLLDTEGLNLVFDSGLKLTEPPTGPMQADRVNAAFLSHAHLDHCGFLPALHRQNKMPVYATPITFEMSHMIQLDSIHIEKLKGYPVKYTERDVSRMAEGEIHIQYDREYRFHNKIDFTFIDAGHIPGSAGILVDCEGKKVFYTGDTHSTGTRLMNAARYPDKADVVITESTYGNGLHPPRKEVEAAFLDEVESTLANGGTALVPVFAIGRTQEILLLLKDQDADVYLDGMARRATQTVLKYPDTIKNADQMQEAMENTIWVKDRRQRKKISTEPCIIVTTAGMLEGGPVMDYISHMHKDANSSVILTGYQVEDTNGRRLIDKRIVIDEMAKKKYHVAMKVSQFDFSAHSDRDELIKTINGMDPEHVILMHGDPEAIEALKGDFPGRKVHAPELGETIKLE